MLAERGRLGFNAKYLIEMGEETGSPGLRDVCAEHRDSMQADLLLREALSVMTGLYWDLGSGVVPALSR